MLHTSELARFSQDGFLKIEGVLDDQACKYFIEKTWQKLPSTWERDNPSTWHGDVADSCHVASLDYRRGMLKFQKGDLLGDIEVDRSFGSDSKLAAFARSLTGADFAPLRIRGLYPNIPPPDAMGLREYVSPHVEAHPATLVAIAYFQDVGPGAGGLLVWPGSHRPLYTAFSSKLDFEATARYGDLLDTHSALKPVELTGQKGDVILTHHRLFHAPSLNRSQNIRFAFLCDYTFANFKDLCGQKPGYIWEDWPSMMNLKASVRDQPTRYVMNPWLRSERMGSVQLIATESTRDKRDATNLARARHAGETWLVASDDDHCRKDNQLDPSGSCLTEQGVQVTVAGVALTSQSHNGFVCRLPFEDGTRPVVVKAGSSPLWVKVIRMKSPLMDSSVDTLVRISAHGSIDIDLGHALPQIPSVAAVKMEPAASRNSSS